MLAHFEEVNLLSETLDDAKNGDKSNWRSNSLISEEEMDVIDSGNESDDEPMSTEMLEDICAGSQSHLNVNRRGSRYKTRDRI